MLDSGGLVGHTKASSHQISPMELDCWECEPHSEGRLCLRSWLCISGQHKLPPCHACSHLVHPLQDTPANIPILTRFGSKQVSSLFRQQLTALRHCKSCMGMLIVSSFSYFPSNQDIHWTHLCPTKPPVERNKSLESKLKYL